MSQNMRLGKSAVVRWEWFGEAGKLWTSNPVAWIGMSAIVFFVLVVLAVLPIVFIIVPAGIFASNNNPGAALATAGFALLLIPVIAIVLLVVGAYFASGMYRAAIRQARGEAIRALDLFSGGENFPRILGLFFLLAVVQVVAAAVIRIPGMVIRELTPLLGLLGNLLGAIIGGFTFFAAPLIVDRKLGISEAISASVKATKDQWWMFAIFSFVLGIVCFIGLLGCGIGLAASLPFLFVTPAVAYRDTFGLPGAQNYGGFQAPAPPDYRNYAPSPMSTPQAPPRYESSHRPEPAPRPEPPPYRPAPPPQPEPPYRPAPPQPEPTYRPAPPPPQLEPTYRPAPPQPPPAPESTTTTCPQCGAKLNRVANFCNQCGNRLGNA
jgi:hypothetical protein